MSQEVTEQSWFQFAFNPQGKFVPLPFGSRDTRRTRDELKIRGRAKIAPLWRAGTEDGVASKRLRTSAAPESCSSGPAVPRVP